MIRTRILAVVLALASAALLAACGGQPAQKNESYQSVSAQVAETEGVYLDIEGLKYQVQVSRMLNPASVEDRAYFLGLSPDDAQISKDEEWFAVFLRAENEKKRPAPVATQFMIKDTQENVYRPIRIGPQNVFAYRPAIVRDGHVLPDPNSPAGERPPQGLLLLFKLRRFSTNNRPLELTITGQQGQQGIVNLDV